LDRVANVDELKELEQGRDARRLLMLRRLVCPHLLRRNPEAGGNVPVAERLQQEDEDLLDRLFHATADSAWVERKGLDTLERLSITLDELESDVERDEELQRLERLRLGSRRRRA
jgi:hypothetical protein